MKDSTLTAEQSAGLNWHTLIGVTGDFVPASAVLNPLFLARMIL